MTLDPLHSGSLSPSNLISLSDFITSRLESLCIHGGGWGEGRVYVYTFLWFLWLSLPKAVWNWGKHSWPEPWSHLFNLLKILVVDCLLNRLPWVAARRLRLGLLLIVRHLTNSWGSCWLCYHCFQKQRSIPCHQPQNKGRACCVLSMRISSRLGLPRPSSGGHVILQEMWHVCFSCWLYLCQHTWVSNIGKEAGL